MQSARAEVDRHLAFAGKVKIPVRRADKDPTADEVTDESRDQGFPDVIAYRDLWVAVPDGDRDKIHVGNNVVETESHKGEGREPDGNDLGNDLARGDRVEDGKAHEPIRTDCPAQDLVPLRSYRLHCCETDDLCMILWRFSKDSSVPGDDSHEE